jgi:hypothetical protein
LLPLAGARQGAMCRDAVLAPVATGIRMDGRTGVGRRRCFEVSSRSSTAEYESEHEDELRELHAILPPDGAPVSGQPG